jgi:hypothetical protein
MQRLTGGRKWDATGGWRAYKDRSIRDIWAEGLAAVGNYVARGLGASRVSFAVSFVFYCIGACWLCSKVLKERRKEKHSQYSFVSVCSYRR